MQIASGGARGGETMNDYDRFSALVYLGNSGDYSKYTKDALRRGEFGSARQYWRLMVYFVNKAAKGIALLTRREVATLANLGDETVDLCTMITRAERDALDRRLGDDFR